MLSPSDKLGGAPLKPSQLQWLPSLMTNTSTIDIPCLQRAFSWRGFFNNNPIYERLDRAVCSNSVFTDF